MGIRHYWRSFLSEFGEFGPLDVTPGERTLLGIALPPVRAGDWVTAKGVVGEKSSEAPAAGLMLDVWRQKVMLGLPLARSIGEGGQHVCSLSQEG